MSDKKEINVVLSGGSARGLAHVGVLSVLEKSFRIKSIIGTSMGAIIGGLYAYGYSPEDILELRESLNVIERFLIFKPSFQSSGLSDGEGLLKFFEEKTDNTMIEDCRINFAAIAYDLRSKRSVILDRNSLAKAMRSSSSLPFVFSPFRYGKYLFVDGFVEHPLPVKFANYFSSEGLTVACSVLPPVPLKHEVFQIDEEEEEKKKEHLPGMIDVFIQTNFYSQSSAVIDALLDAKPDIYISAYCDSLKFWELDEADQFFTIGKEAAEKALDEYHSDKEHSKHRRFIKSLHNNYQLFRKKARRDTDAD